MTDLQETPATPPMDPGGDERVGYLAAGVLLILVGWGLAIALNVVLHATAPSSGWLLGPWRIGSSFGAYAQATLLLGLFTGLLGVGLLLIGRRAPRGPLVVPGYPYP